MAIELIDKIKPKNGGGFPMVDAQDVLMPDGSRLHETLARAPHRPVGDYLTPQMFGAVGDGAADDTQAFNDCIGALMEGETKTMYIPAGTYRCEGTISIAGASHLRILCDGELYAVPRATVQELFYIIDSSDLYFRNISIRSDRTMTATPPAGHTLKNPVSSNVRGFYLAGCSDIEVDGLKAFGLSCDVCTLCSPSSGHSSSEIINYNIRVHGVYSREGDGSIYVQQTKNACFYDLDIVPAGGLGFGNHIVYIAQYCDHIHIYDGVFHIPDGYFGYAIIARYAGDNGMNTPLNPDNIFVDNIACTGCGGFYSVKSRSVSMITNCHVVCQDPWTAAGGYDAEWSWSNRCAIVSNQDARTLLSGCDIYAPVSVTQLATGSIKFSACSLRCVKLIASSMASYGVNHRLRFDGCAISCVKDTSPAFVSLSLAGNIDFNHCTFDAQYGYIFQVSDTSANGHIYLRGCDISGNLSLNNATLCYNCSYQNLVFIDCYINSNYRLSNNGYTPKIIQTVTDGRALSGLLLKSATADSGKVFQLTVDDAGVLTAVETTV